MLRLALLRHSEAHAHAAGGDKERSLTDAGRDMAQRMGRYCRALPLLPDLVIVSPSQRTRQTYDFFASESGHKLNAVFDPELYNATSTTIKATVARVSSDHKIVLVIGHNPGIAEAAIAFSGTGDRAMLSEMRNHFPAPALVVVDFQIATWAELAAGQGKLDRFVTKTQLKS
jgi:phosphohistidine phosphatase